jgi:ubiquinone/menaquinone biosynthesis C-methylase UbiE
MRPELQRRVQRYGWNKAAGFYDRSWSEQLKPVQDRFVEMAEFDSGERVLETACGTGLITFRIADAVLPGGQVTATDLSDEMVQMTRKAVQEKEHEHIAVQRMDSEALDLEPGQFDAAISCLGVMYVPDPRRSYAEKHRVLKPGGRTVIATWGERKHCGWAEIFPIVEKRVASDVCPLFFQQGTGDTLVNELRSAGFRQVEAVRFRTGMTFPTRDVALMAAFAGGPVALAYHKFDDETRQSANREYLESIEPYRQNGGYVIPGEFVIATGRK